MINKEKLINICNTYGVEVIDETVKDIDISNALNNSVGYVFDKSSLKRKARKAGLILRHTQSEKINVANM